MAGKDDVAPVRQARRRPHGVSPACAAGAVDPQRRVNRDELAYVADMVAEMATLAAGLDCPTLTGILELAHREAEREMARRT